MKYITTSILLLALSFCCKQEALNPTQCEQKCALEPQVGPCNAAFRKYYFDQTEKKCKEFTWGGCAGVVPFETLEECQACGCN